MSISLPYSDPFSHTHSIWSVIRQVDNFSLCPTPKSPKPVSPACSPAWAAGSSVALTAGGRRALWGCQRARTHTHASSRPRGRARPGLAVAMMQWRLRRGKRARSWMSSLHSWSEAAADSQDTETAARRQRQQRVLPHYMAARSQVCLLASQLAVSWRLSETFLTHLYDVAARREEEKKHQHPVRPP